MTKKDRTEETTAILQSVKDAVEATEGQWIDCCWTHELVVNGHKVDDENDNTVLCDGGTEHCEYCEAANQSAIGASYAVGHVVGYWEQGEYEMALSAAVAAETEELIYGDAPVYSQLVVIIEEAIGSILQSLHTEDTIMEQKDK